MIFKKNSQLDKIKRFKVNQFGLFCLTGDLTIPQIPEIELARTGFHKVHTYLNLVGDFLFVQDTSGRAILYDLKYNRILDQHLDDKTPGYGFASLDISGDRNILCCKMIEGVEKKFILNVDSRALTEICSDFNMVSRGGKILLRRQLDPESVSRVDLDGTELWEYNIEGTYIDPVYTDKREKPCKLDRILGEHNHLLWLANTSKELYALDVKTGEKVFSCFDAGFAKYFSLDKKHNRLVSVSEEYLRTVDLSDGKFELSKIEMSDVFDKLGLRPNYTGGQLPVVDDHLIFCDKFQSVVGTIRIENGEVDWVFDLFPTRDGATIREMRYSSDKLYVYDNVGASDFTVGSLHIFDRII